MLIREATDYEAWEIAKYIGRYPFQAHPGFPKTRFCDVLEAVDRIREVGSCLVAIKDGEIVGTMGLMIQQWWFNKTKPYMGDVWLFVSEEHRKSGAGMALIKSAIRRAKAARVPLMLGVYGGVDVQRKDRLYEYLGFERVGGMYRMEA